MDVHELAKAILNHAIQLTLLAGIVWCVAKLFAKNRPHLAHSLWILVLLKCVVPPAWSSPTSLFNIGLLDMGLCNSVGAKADPSQIPLQATADQSSSTSTDASGANSTTSDSSEYRLSVVVGEGSGLPMSPECTTLELLSQSMAPASWQPFAKIPRAAIVFGILALAIGFACGLLSTCARLLYFLKAAYSKGYYHDVEIDDFVRQLSKRLGVKRTVSIRLVRNPIGPVVLGLIRPTLLLPELIVRGKKPVDLEPLIAHELIHIRRGDLWWAMLQAIATSLWWFHPLVRLAGRMVSRETERSCDEETVASLGCSPALYARSLLDVLERKHQLQIAPALPGVRPIEVTLDRMERIMKLGQGSHLRTPRWIWAALLIGCAVTLPSGSVGVAQDEKELEPATAAEALGPVPLATKSDFSKHWQSYREDVGDLIDALKGQGMSEVEARRWILSQLPFRHQEDAKIDGSRVNRIIVDASVESDLGISGKVSCNVPAPQILDRELQVFDTNSKIEEINTQLSFLRETCGKLVSCEVRFVSLTQDVFKEVSMNWAKAEAPPVAAQNKIESTIVEVDGKTVPAARVTANAVPDTKMGVALAAAQSKMQLAFDFAKPVSSYVLSDEEFDATTNHKDVRCITAPRVTGRSGQTVTMGVHTDSKAVDEGLFLEGTCIELNPTIIEGQKVILRIKYLHYNRQVPVLEDPGTDKKRPWNDTGGHGKRVLEAMRLHNPTGRVSADATMRLALDQYEQGNFKQAADTITDLLTTYPDSEHRLQAQFLLQSLTNGDEGPEYSLEELASDSIKYSFAKAVNLTSEAQLGKTHVFCLPTKIGGEDGVLALLVRCAAMDSPKIGDAAGMAEQPSEDSQGFVNIAGAVKQPAQYKLDKPTTVARAIASAGGIQIPSNQSPSNQSTSIEPTSIQASEPTLQVTILRELNDGSEYIVTNFTLDRAQLGKETTQADELWLKKNDIVVVKPASPAATSAQAKTAPRTNHKTVLMRVPIVGPVTAGEQAHTISRPADDEMLQALNKLKKLTGEREIEGKQIIRFELEKLTETEDAKRFIPLIGNAVLHHTFYKCTLHLRSTDKLQVFFIDHQHFHMVP